MNSHPPSTIITISWRRWKPVQGRLHNYAVESLPIDRGVLNEPHPSFSAVRLKTWVMLGPVMSDKVQKSIFPPGSSTGINHRLGTYTLLGNAQVQMKQTKNPKLPVLYNTLQSWLRKSFHC